MKQSEIKKAMQQRGKNLQYHTEEAKENKEAMSQRWQDPK